MDTISLDIENSVVDRSVAYYLSSLLTAMGQTDRAQEIANRLREIDAGENSGQREMLLPRQGMRWIISGLTYPATQELIERIPAAFQKVLLESPEIMLTMVPGANVFAISSEATDYEPEVVPMGDLG